MAKSDRPLSVFERAVQTVIGVNGVLGSPDDPAKETYPSLWQWLSTTHVGKDQVKVPAVLSIRLGPDGVLVSLVDRDLCVSIEASCAHLDSCLAEVEAVLNSAHPPLKNWGKKEPRLRRRRSV